ncbi:RecQ family ATP-dependent DNA helicase [Evansella cellulosilytica]|uniref:ATP-dependent DNA helicase, RecQ family n=1 Tax=Evansella cellulosilytica (strain ATCC 21833 / DSM 2522 / FERM P-1141 / JCM 9156 / N-4) TaxID=649639 RepID=E6TYP4_EVAC2|nr:ATP-dependent DNA helicase RecQ [Evansella cellulosilytica]ADU30094.1 ATP-dependent DNA helicase, RecQ family [Evansella cellulosilytica DSM 2522]
MAINMEQFLTENFGYREFRIGQREVIESVLKGNDVVAILPTGAGKTLCYHYPAKIIKGLTIVVSPLLSLMEDQVHQLRAKGDKNVVQLNGLLSFNEKMNVLHSLHEQSILFISPEMLMNERVLQRLSHIHVGLFVIDEAHCISQWGHEFRTDYLRLSNIKQMLHHPPCLAVTATATKQVEEDIINKLALSSPIVHRFSVNRQEIKFVFEEVKTSKHKMERLYELLETLQKPTIIYTATRKEAEELSEDLRIKGTDDVAYYHGGMTKEDRLLVQHQFIKDEVSVICCTNAFGMGINKPNIRTVIHLNIPVSLEQYVQEVGRAGRDNDNAVALLLHCKEDRRVPLSFIDMEYPEDQELKSWFSLLHHYSREHGPFVKVDNIKHHFIDNETKWRMFLYYLEISNVLHDNGDINVNLINEVLLNKLQSYFHARKKMKKTKFYYFQELLKRDSCIRKEILKYFNESLTSKTSPCCSSCGLHVSSIFNSKKKNAIQELKKGTWQEELDRILLTFTEV